MVLPLETQLSASCQLPPAVLMASEPLAGTQNSPPIPQKTGKQDQGCQQRNSGMSDRTSQRNSSNPTPWAPSLCHRH